MSKNESIIVAILAILVIIVLPTGIDDAFTTIPIINTIGVENYLLLATALIILLEELKGRR